MSIIRRGRGKGVGEGRGGGQGLGQYAWSLLLVIVLPSQGNIQVEEILFLRDDKLGL